MSRDEHLPPKRKQKGQEEIARRMAEQPDITDKQRAENLKSDVIGPLLSLVGAVEEKRNKDKKVYLVLRNEGTLTRVRKLLAVTAKSKDVQEDTDKKDGTSLILADANKFLSALNDKATSHRSPALRAAVEKLANDYDLPLPTRGRRY